MELDAFTSRLGISQGRVVAPDASVSFVLGYLEAGRFADLAVGDFVEVVQALDVTGVALVRASLTLRAPRAGSPGSTWEAAMVVDGAVGASARGAPGRARDVVDLAANVSKLTGMHEVGVRLALVKAV
jgi:hypothetical protein